MPIRELSPDLKACAEKELNENPKRIQQDIQAIREWLAKQPHLPSQLDDQWILSFLRGCKHSLERTKEKLDTYYTARAMLPDYFVNRDPLLPEIQEILSLGMMVMLPEPDNKGRRVFLMRQGILDPQKHKIDLVNKVSFMVMDVTLKDDDRNIVFGQVSVLDLKDVTMAHLVQMTPTKVKQMMTVFQDGYPFRPKGLNYINLPAGIDYVFNLFKSFMKKKLQDRITLHGNSLDSLYTQVPKEILPAEYGGNAGKWVDLAAEMKKKIEDNRDWLMNEEKFKADESKRPGKPKTESELFGLDGSFRKLEVD